MSDEPTQRIGLVLSGGGSRGAYEAGIVAYLRNKLAKRLDRRVHFDIITGTSVGAINAAYLGATMNDPDTQADQICQAWRSLEIESLISLQAVDIFRGFKRFLTSNPKPPSPGSYRYGGLLDTSGLERFVLRHIPWQGIRRNLQQGHFESLAVSATHVGSGHTVVFIDSHREVPDAWSKDPFVRRHSARIGPRHVLASAAIPLLFPAVKIGDSFYTDGGLRQNTPMSPAIRLGATKLLVISLRHLRTEAEQDAALTHEREMAYPRPLFIAGKALNALLLDHTVYDLDRLARLNGILAAGEDAFGERFRDVINDELIKRRRAPLRYVHPVHIRPSLDIGAIASDYVRERKITVRGRMARRLLDRLARSEARHESDLLSYLLFDGNYASELIDLGMRDAEAHEETLAALFNDAGPARTSGR